MTSPSIKRMILIMFEDDYQYLPSLREIRDSLIGAQMRRLEQDQKLKQSDKQELDHLKKKYEKKWKYLFMIRELGDLEKPLTPYILANPYHPITKHKIGRAHV